MKIAKKLEIERRWLLSSDKETAQKILKQLENTLSSCEKSKIKQWYITTNPVLRLRSHDENQFVLCVKARGNNNSFGIPESESELNKEEFENLYKFVKKEALVKTRYFISLLGNNLTAELDVFEEYLSGFIIVEVEFKNKKASQLFEPPLWFGNNEITGQKAYANSYLVNWLPDKKVLKTF